MWIGKPRPRGAAISLATLDAPGATPHISHWPLDSSEAAPQKIARAATTASRTLKVQAHLRDCRIALKIAASSGYIFEFEPEFEIGGLRQ
jgi:hypothetical protein